MNNLFFLKHSCPVSSVEGGKTSVVLWAGAESGLIDSDQKWAELSASLARNLSLRSECLSEQRTT